MLPKLTVIIPAHNCAKKIKRSTNSVLQQSYENIELIVVENGSQDGTFEACCKIAAGDSRCVVLQSNVKSTLIARKTGIDYATGEYITFCDADDYYKDRDSLKRLMKAALESKADIVQFGNIVNRFGKKTESLRVKEKLVIDRKRLLEEDVAGVMGGWNQKIHPTVWTKIYRSEVLKDITCDLNIPLIRAEDLYLNCCAFFSEKTKLVAFVPLIEYVYNTVIGVSSDGLIAVEDLFEEYQVFKTKAVELARRNQAGEKNVLLCHRETLRYLDNLIKMYIILGDSRNVVCDRITEYWDFISVQMARSYFREYMMNNELDEEMSAFAELNDPIEYYNYCLQRIPHIKGDRAKYKIKHIVKTGLRFLDRILI